MKSNIIKDFNLPSYLKGKSFAEAAKAINKKFEGRESDEVKRTKEELLARVAKAQEYTKMQESLKANSQEVPDMMNGQLPQGVDPSHLEQSQMAEGGWADMTGTEKMGAGAGMVGTGLELGQMAFGKTGVDTTGLAGRQEKVSEGGMAASGAMKGFQAGMATGNPFVAAGGALIGGAAGFFGGKSQNKDISQGNRNAALIENNQFSNDFAMGGKLPGKKNPDPTNPDLDKKDLKSINASTGIAFTEGGMNSLFKRVPTDGDGAPALNFGKYGDVGYFEMGNIDQDTYRIANTAKNPHNAQTINPIVEEIRKLNPGKNIKLDYNNSFSGGGPMGTKFGDIDLTQPTTKLGTTGLIPSMSQNAVQDPKWSMNHDGVTKGVKSDYQMGPNETTFKGQAIPDPAKDMRTGASLGGVVDWTKENYGNILRAAPIVGNALQLAKLKPADRVSLDRLDARYKENLVDERAMTNQIENSTAGTNQAIANASNGSIGALRSNLLGAGLNKTQALSQAHLQAQQMNNAENTRGQQFNASVDAQNLRQGAMEQQINDQNEGMYNSAKSALQSQMATDIGNFGKEKVNMKQVAEMFGYTWDGKYLVDKDGKKITVAQAKKLQNKASE